MLTQTVVFNTSCFNAAVYYVSGLRLSTDQFVSHELLSSKTNVNFLKFFGWISDVKGYFTKHTFKENIFEIILM